MTKKIKLALLFLSMIPLLLCHSVVYAQGDEGNTHFDKSYQGKLNGYTAHDILEVAKAQKGKSLTDLGLRLEDYRGYYQVYFLVNCERLAGAEKPYLFDLPPNGDLDDSADILKKSLLQSGRGTEITQEEAVPGDLVFYNCEHANGDKAYANSVRIIADYGAQYAVGFGEMKKVSDEIAVHRETGDLSLTFIHPHYSDSEPVSSTGIRLQDFKYEVADSYYDYVAGKQINEKVLIFDEYTGKEDTLKIPAVINFNGEKRKVILRNIFEYNKNIKHISFEDGVILTQGSFDRIHAFAYSGIESIDLAGLDISHVNNLNALLHDCESLKNAYHTETLNTANITSLQDAFNTCKSLTSLNINSWDVSNVTDMKNLFRYCSSLTSIELDKWNTSKVTDFHSTFMMSGVTDLDVSTWECKSSKDFGSMFEGIAFKTIKLPKNFNAVEEDTFRLLKDCTVYFQGTKKQWCAMWKSLSTNQFSDTIDVICTDGKFKADEAKEDAPEYEAKLTDPKTGMKYVVTRSGKKDGTVKFVGTTKKKAKTITIPEKVKLKGITYKVTAIGYRALKGNKKITTVKVGKNVKEIEYEAFCDCTNLSNLTLGKSVTTIGEKAIYNTKIKNLILPEKTTNLHGQFIGKCSKLKTLTIKSKSIYEKKVGQKAFSGIGKKVIIKVPKGKVKAYNELFRKKGLNKKVKVQANN